MTSQYFCRRPGLHLLLAACFLGASFALTADADARRTGKKAGWSHRSAIKGEKGTPRRGLFTRARSTPQRIAASSRPPRERSQALSVSIPSTSSLSQPKRTGLLARLFGPVENGPKPTRARTTYPPKPRLAPGQPNASQSAPKIDYGLIASSSKSQSSITINIARQRAYVYIGGKIVVDTPVSTARSGKYTPRGTFRIGERVHTGKISNLYDVEMPRWMRLGSTPFGMHAGYLPGYPASAGCIRMPYSAADAIYKATGYGTRVRITSQ